MSNTTSDTNSNNKLERIADLTKSLLEELGEDPNREGLLKTPIRVAEAWMFVTSGYAKNPHEVLHNALFNATSHELVSIAHIDFFSICEHHMLPFFGTVDVAYLPNEKVIGLSKVPRIVDIFARRLQIQENLTNQVADTLDELLKPRGIGVVSSAVHLCMMMRGVEKVNSKTTIVTTRGMFSQDTHAMNWLQTIHESLERK